MKKIFTLWLLASFSILFNSCLAPDDIQPNPVTFEKIADVPQLVPYQTFAFGGNKYPGIIQNYKVFFGATEIPVSKITSDSIYVFVPMDVQIGLKDVKLMYKDSEFILGKVDIIDWNTVSPHNITYFRTKDEEHPYHITDSLSNAVIPHVTNGKIDKIYLVGHDGKSSIIELLPSGLPSSYYTEKETIIFGGYDLTNYTVNIARFPTGKIDEVVYKYGLPLDPAKVKALTEAMRKRLATGRYAGEPAGFFDIVGTVLEVTSCIAGTALAVAVPPATILHGVPLALTCASATYSVIKVINPDSDHAGLSTVQSVHGIKMNLINCLNAISQPKNAANLFEKMSDCYELALDAAKGANDLYTEFRKSAERDLQKAQAVLATGYGDIKITLDWNSTADIDLWVIDPNGEKIYFNHRISSTAGKLDLDDTNGYGPENVYWPINKAPFGKYMVQVHYYGPRNGPATSYKVLINNFGKSKTFSGTLSYYNQIITVSTFEAKAEWNNSGGRMAGPNIIFADRSVLPLKE